ncbi:hypothetical protein ACIBOV_28090 [Micromonospora chersina]|uniref:hypothetical protein n=1 Tax=Micromonospora chersina TaxID=47854 RepID=UPI0037891EF6
MNLLRNRIGRRITAGFAMILLALGITTVVNPAPASASATSCVFYGAMLNTGVHNGQFCGSVNGSGTYINYVTGSFGATIPGVDVVCNPSIKLDVFDRYDRWIASRQGSQKWGCFYGTWNSVNSISVYWGFPQADGGRLYVTLQSSGSRVATTSYYFHS